MDGMTEREVLRIVTPTATSDGAGVRLQRSIATPELDSVDPFFLFDHFGSDNPDDYIAGFPMHPHRGIETITYVLDGRVEHKDSLGNAGVIGPGDVQWMTAGSGIMHEEMPKVESSRLNGFQIWLNLPAKLKMTDPRYRGIPSTQIPEVVRPDGTRIRIIAGEVDGLLGAVTEVFADPTYLDVTLPPGCHLEQLITRGHTALIYVFEGEITVGESTSMPGKLVPATQLVLLTNGDLVYLRTGNRGARFLLLSAQPLKEPAVRFGPFIMNTREEVALALDELRDGTFVKVNAAVQ